MRLFTKCWYFFAVGLLSVIAALFLTRNALPSTTAQRIPDVVDFNFHIRPILSDRCFKCHGPDASLADPPKILITNEEVKNILTFINKKDKDPVAVMVMKDSSVVRPTYVLMRGAYDAPGEEVIYPS